MDGSLIQIENIIKKPPVKSLKLDDIDMFLLGSTENGQQVIRHALQPGAVWTLLPELGYDDLTYHCVVLSGHIQYKTNSTRGTLVSGQSISVSPFHDLVELHALTHTEYILTASHPVFDIHIHGLCEMEALVVSIEQKDGYTSDHCGRIKRLSLRVAQHFDLTPQQNFDLRIGSFLHDVGKVKIPETVLNKPGPLTPNEWRLMRLHPLYGKQMLLQLSQSSMFGPSLIVEQHHERYNGSGYPHGLKGEQIHIGAAIVAVVDSYDAMTTDRVYRKAMSVNQALGELKRCRGTLYHPDVVDVFLALEGASTKEEKHSY